VVRLARYKRDSPDFLSIYIADECIRTCAEQNARARRIFVNLLARIPNMQRAAEQGWTMSTAVHMQRD